MTIYPYQEVFSKWSGLAILWARTRGNLTPSEILATITEESSGNPSSFNPNDPSYGLMGISVPIGKAYANVTAGEELYDPTKNVTAGSGFQSYLKKTYALRFPLGVERGWIQMYNTGETQFLKGLRVPGYELAFLTHRSAFETMFPAPPL